MYVIWINIICDSVHSLAIDYRCNIELDTVVKILRCGTEVECTSLCDCLSWCGWCTLVLFSLINVCNLMRQCVLGSFYPSCRHKNTNMLLAHWRIWHFWPSDHLSMTPVSDIYIGYVTSTFNSGRHLCAAILNSERIKAEAHKALCCVCVCVEVWVINTTVVLPWPHLGINSSAFYDHHTLIDGHTHTNVKSPQLMSITTPTHKHEFPSLPSPRGGRWPAGGQKWAGAVRGR